MEHEWVLTERSMKYKACFNDLRTFGIELELFGVPKEEVEHALNSTGIKAESREYTKADSGYWRLSYDSSIIGRDPIEIASPILCGREGLEEVRKAVSKLAEIGCQVNWSCGYHVHWNCGDYTGKNMLSLLRLYTKFEGVIDYFVAPSRRANLNKHCSSLVKDFDLKWINELDPTEKARAIDVTYKFADKHRSTDPELVHRGQASSRYHKVNIHAYQQYGTIEFRHHQGTVNPEKVINWLVFTQQLVNKSKHVPVSKQVSAKPTLGELLRVLRLPEHCLIEDECTDPLILHLGEWLKKRYTQFREELTDE